MVQETRIGEMRMMSLTASLGLTLALGMCGTALAGDEGTRDRAMFTGRRTGDAYVLSRGGHGTSTSTSVDELVKVKKKFSGEFLWVRRGGKAFLIRDRAVLDQAQTCFAPLQALDPERNALQAKQREIEREEAVLEREQEELERQEEDLEDDRGESAASAREDIQRRQDELRPRVERQEARERDLERVEEALDEREEVLEQKAEEQLWQLIDATLARGAAERVDRR
jgi:hypothetical protein